MMYSFDDCSLVEELCSNVILDLKNETSLVFEYVLYEVKLSSHEPVFRIRVYLVWNYNTSVY